MDIKTCEICGKQKVRELIGFSKNQMEIWVAQCSCEKDEYEKKENEKEIESLLKESNIPAMYQNEDMKDWVRVKGTESLTNSAKRWIENIDENAKNGKGMFVYGPVGTGKTKVMCYILKHIIKTRRWRVHFISMDQLSGRLSRYKDGTRELEEFVESIYMKKILLIDDLGESTISEWRQKQFSRIINERYYAGRPTFFNTMKPIDELEDLLGKHMISRIVQMSEGYIVEVESEIDMRLSSNRQKYIKQK